MTVLTLNPSGKLIDWNAVPRVRLYPTWAVWLIAAAMVLAVALTTLVGWVVTR